MKKIFFSILVLIIYGCQVSDTTYELPANYVYEEEGGYANIVVRDHKLIIGHGAFDYSVDENYIMFVYDTTDVINQPKKIDNEKLFFLVHCIKKDSLSKVMSFEEYRNFVSLNKILRTDDLSIRDYSKYAE